MSACVNVVMLREVPWPGQGDLGWDSRIVVFSIMLVAITIALDDEEKKLSKRRPEKPPALNSSSREVDSWVEALRFDRRAGALGLHLCGFSKPLWLVFFFGRESIFKTNFQNQFSQWVFGNQPKTDLETGQRTAKTEAKTEAETGQELGEIFQFSKTSFQNQTSFQKLVPKPA